MLLKVEEERVRKPKKLLDLEDLLLDGEEVNMQSIVSYLVTSNTCYQFLN